MRLLSMSLINSSRSITKELFDIPAAVNDTTFNGLKWLLSTLSEPGGYLLCLGCDLADARIYSLARLESDAW